MFTEPFMQRALIAAVLLGPLCALLGVFVTARRMAFFSETVAHGAMAGIAIGFWLGLTDPSIPILVFSLLVAGAILWLKEFTELLTDTIMALLLSGSVAIGIIILSLMRGFRSEIHAYLFGDVLAIGSKDVWILLVLFVVVVTSVLMNLSHLSLITANEDLAHASGIAVRRMNYFFIIVLTCTVALSIRLLGIIMVTSLLIIPAATARNLSRTLRQQIVFSLMAGLFGAFGGVTFSYRFEVPCGPAIVLTCILLFLGSLVVLGIRRARSRNRLQPSTP